MNLGYEYPAGAYEEIRRWEIKEMLYRDALKEKQADVAARIKKAAVSGEKFVALGHASNVADELFEEFSTTKKLDLVRAWANGADFSTMNKLISEMLNDAIKTLTETVSEMEVEKEFGDFL